MNWLWQQRSPVIALLLVVVLLVPQPAKGQFIDWGAVVAAIQAIGSAINKVIGGGLQAINGNLGTTNKQLNTTNSFFKNEVYPAQAITRAHGVAGTVQAIYNLIRGLVNLNVASATRPNPRQLETVLLSRNPANIGQVGGRFTTLYQPIPTAKDAPPAGGPGETPAGHWRRPRHGRGEPCGRPAPGGDFLARHPALAADPAAAPGAASRQEEGPRRPTRATFLGDAPCTSRFPRHFNRLRPPASPRLPALHYPGASEAMDCRSDRPNASRQTADRRAQKKAKNEKCMMNPVPKMNTSRHVFSMTSGLPVRVQMTAFRYRAKRGKPDRIDGRRAAGAATNPDREALELRRPVCRATGAFVFALFWD